MHMRIYTVILYIYQCILPMFDLCIHVYICICIGKYGNQGVDLADVTDITIGRATEILQTNGQEVSVDLYLSIISNGKSIDLCFQRCACIYIICYEIYTFNLFVSCGWPIKCALLYTY